MFRLATGRYSDCPFTDQVPPHQPFFLAAIEVKTRKYDESDYTPVAANYSSAKEIRIEVAGGQPGRNTKGPGDIAKVMDVCQNSDCGVDHGYLCCRSDDSSDVVWVNRVGW